jgi:hypothetical protein
MDAASADSTSALAPDSMKMTTEDGLEQMEMVPDSMDMTTEDGLEQEMDMVPDSRLPSSSSSNGTLRSKAGM